MPVTPGARLGPYEIVSLLGAGGMGEVYKARDTRLDRTIAIKVLPHEFSADSDRRARFEREAKTIAGLNHPHICTLHDVGDHDGAMFLVMEHLSGQTLAARLDKGPLPLEQALTIATEIGDALSAAHRQGVIHRDLKPGNVMLTKSGAKLLDFGLAKLTGHGEEPAARHVTSAPTRSAPLTGEGVIVGTLQYMAPEQLDGKPPDARTDLWALGAILYEMVTGKRAFEGTSAVSLMGAILERDPTPIASLQPLTPPALDRLVRQCLAKSPDDRPDTAHDVANQLRWMRETSGVGAAPGVQLVRRRNLRTALVIASVAVLAAGAGAGVMWSRRPAVAPAPVARLTVEVRPADELNGGGVSLLGFLPTPGGTRTALTWTPDGQALIFVGRRGGVQQLYTRRLGAADATPIPNTEGGQVPAVSPDGQWVAFWAGGAIKKAALGGGPAMDLAPSVAAPPWGLVWDDHAGLVFAEGVHIWAIPAAGGKPKAVTTVGEGELAHTLPSLLPGGRVLLYTVRKRAWTWGDEEVVAQPLPTGDRKRLLTDAADARYVPATGHLVFLRRGVLYAVPFDAERLEVRGREVPVLDAVAQALTAGNGYDVTGAGQFTIASTGTLAWLPGPVAPFEESALVTVDRRGQVTPLRAPVRDYSTNVRVSPDGRRLAALVQTMTEVGLWLYDLNRTTLTRLPVDGEADWFVWTPNGQHLVFAWVSGGRYSVADQIADGTTPPHVLLPGPFSPSSSTPDGRRVAGLRDGDVHIITLEDGKASVQPLWQTSHSEQWPAFSPDGRWLAYGSNGSGRDEVYVRPYPGAGPEGQVSIEGGDSPAWNPNRRELFFLTPTDAAGKIRMMAADFAPGPPPRIGRPRPLFEFDQRDLGFACVPVRCYDVAPDGQRFYAVQPRTSPRTPVVTHVNLIQNWFEELKAKVPPAR